MKDKTILITFLAVVAFSVGCKPAVETSAAEQHQEDLRWLERGFPTISPMGKRADRALSGELVNKKQKRKKHNEKHIC